MTVTEKLRCHVCGNLMPYCTCPKPFEEPAPQEHPEHPDQPASYPLPEDLEEILGHETFCELEGIGEFVEEAHDKWVPLFVPLLQAFDWIEAHERALEAGDEQKFFGVCADIATNMILYMRHVITQMQEEDEEDDDDA